MASITAIASDFFAACETGKGWEVCKAYCTPNATFVAQAEPLADIKTLAEIHGLDEGTNDDYAGR